MYDFQVDSTEIVKDTRYRTLKGMVEKSICEPLVQALSFKTDSKPDSKPECKQTLPSNIQNNTEIIANHKMEKKKIEMVRYFPEMFYFII